MLYWFIERQLKAGEQRIGSSLDYARHLLRVSFRLFLKLSKVPSIAECRRATPPAVFHVARIVATRDADCGACVQIEVNLARQAGVPTDIVRATLEQRVDDLPPELADAYRFSESVVRATWDEAPYRDRLRERFGDEAVAEIALGIAACRVYPVVKRALGYAMSCQKVRIEV